MGPKVSPIRKPNPSKDAKGVEKLFRERFQIEKEQRLAFSKIQASEVSDYLRLAREARVECSAKYKAKNSLAHLDAMEKQIMLDSLEAHERCLKSELLNEVIKTRKKLSEICDIEIDLFKYESENLGQDYSVICFEDLLADISNTNGDKKLAPNCDADMAQTINREVRRQLEIQHRECRINPKLNNFFSDVFF